MPSAPRTFCEQCLRNTTTQGDCEQHPYSRQLSMADPEDREHYQLMCRLRRSRRVPWILLGLYLVSLLSVGGIYYALDHNPSVVGSFIFANLAFLGVLLLACPLLAPVWFFGVLGRDLMLGIRRKIWGIDIEELPEMLTAPIEDPDPMLSAEEARTLRQNHRDARVTAGYGRFMV
ncbi:MAG: hypothetical protein ACI8RZ_000276 [Myxococcota bacterium]|jgi:hypothetical protein